MPTYDYECDHCGHTFELFQGINEPHKKKCPVCKKMKLRRLFGTGAALLFKGLVLRDGLRQFYKADAKKAKQSESVSKKHQLKKKPQQERCL